MEPRHDLVRFLSEKGLEPVLVDVGSSLAPPEIWGPIGQVSTYLGFDPDLRAAQESRDSGFARKIMVDKALTAQEGTDSVEFYLTRFPPCSSTLAPDLESLAHYHFHDLFLVERRAKVAATTLARVLEGTGISRVDWFKTDSQGTDLRLFNSLPPELRGQVLAVDLEPGLVDAYQGEDLLVDAHRELLAQGFWISAFAVKGAVRVHRDTMTRLAELGLDEDLLKQTVRRTPVYGEIRYLRTVEHLNAAKAGPGRYQLLWVFAMLDRQEGFALDVATAYRERFGGDETSREMTAAPLAVMRRRRAAEQAAQASRSLPRRALGRLRRMLSRPAGGGPR